MKFCFYAPFKPLGHAHPSGDLVIATGLFDYIVKQGYNIWPVSRLRSRWIYWKPSLWPHVLRERQRVLRHVKRARPDLWLTYHTYYKAPDLLGPWVCSRAGLAYVIFQGIYSTKRKKDWRTWPGYIINKRALCTAHHIFTNKCEDLLNLKRLLPRHRLTYLTPGILPGAFYFDEESRNKLRRSWNVEGESVVLSAAMFRSGVKADGLALVIRACGKLFRQGKRLHLIIAGDGKEKVRLLRLADEHLPGRVRFVGKVSHNEMYRFYSAGDLFAFPGIQESLGMVYIEAQSCGVPVVAFANGGIPEVVRDQETGFLVPLHDFNRFVQAIDTLLSDKSLCRKMGQAAGVYVRQEHDLDKNYKKMENILQGIVGNTG